MSNRTIKIITRIVITSIPAIIPTKIHKIPLPFEVVSSFFTLSIDGFNELDAENGLDGFNELDAENGLDGFNELDDENELDIENELDVEMN